MINLRDNTDLFVFMFEGEAVLAAFKWVIGTSGRWTRDNFLPLPIVKFVMHLKKKYSHAFEYYKMGCPHSGLQ